MKVALIVVAGSAKQNICFWPSYNSSLPGIDNNLIVVHRNMQHVPVINNKYGKVILENKINNGHELPHRAFGAYREYWKRYQNEYDIFGFISDDVVIKTDYWVGHAVGLLDKYEKLGWVSTQIFNGSAGQYPHPSHCRAPAWFAKSKALRDLQWDFDSDHDGEMRIADQFLSAGYFGAQVGNKIDIAYDSLENGGAFEGDHVSSILEKTLGGNLKQKWNPGIIKNINESLLYRLHKGEDDLKITSPFGHIGERKVVSQLQPFNGLVFDKSLELAQGCYNSFNFGINILK